MIDIRILTDLWRFPKSNAQYLALSSDFLSLPVEADRTLAPVLPDKFDGFVTCDVSNLGGHGGFLESLSTNSITFTHNSRERQQKQSKHCHILL